MSSLTCRFCSHLNPEASKFCNECGSPTHLVPCPACEAINSLSDTRCCRCSALLSSAAEERVTAPVEASIADVPDAAPSVAGMGSIPIALADRMEGFPWAPGVEHDGARAAAATESAIEGEPESEPRAELEAADEPEAEPNTASYAAPDDALVSPDPRDRARYDAHRPGRMRAVLFGFVFVAIVGSVYWSAVAPTQTSQSQAPEVVPPGALQPSAVPPPATPPAATPPAATPPAATPSAETPSTAAASAAVVATTPEPRESASDAPPRAEAPSPAPDTPPPASAQAPADSAPAARASSSTSTRAAAAKSRDNEDARRRAAQRKREQAERDALATQRLIARQLGGTAHAPPATPPTSAQ